jgi:hypothetical protein
MVNIVCASFECYVFADRPVQTLTLNTVEIGNKPSTAIHQSDLEFTVPQNDERYLDPNMQLCIRGQFLGVNGVELYIKDYTAGVNNMLHSLFDQCNISLNGSSITHSSDNYNY